MVHKLDILYQVEIEIIDGFNWYENKQSGLGGNFVEEVERTIKYIEKYPNHYQIKYRNKYREAVLRKFPYVIIYEIIENTIVIFSVFPSKDSPSKKPI